nr:response regulator transcription factor [uncultured Caldimonas sp.]
MSDRPQSHPTDTLPETRVLLVDDHTLVRSALRLLLETIPTVRVVQEAANGAELLAAVDHGEFDVIVTDLVMPEMDGLSAIAELGKRPSRPRLIVLTVQDSLESIRAAIELGVDGYVLKSSALHELELALRSVVKGQSYFSPAVTKRLADSRERPAAAALTERQLQILKLIAIGYANKEIGYTLGLSAKTVTVHRARIMDRLNIRDVAGLVLYSVRHGLVDPKDALTAPTRIQ